MNTVYKEILSNLKRGDASDLTSEVIYNINQAVMKILHTSIPSITPIEVDIMGDILHISNIIYNNTDRSILVLEDGVYDILLEMYRCFNPNFQVGAEPISFDMKDLSNDHNLNTQTNNRSISPFIRVNDVDETSPYYKYLNYKGDLSMSQFINDETSKISKRLRDTSHKYPTLVGTLDKGKFVLNSDAIARGCFENPNVKIFERDFLMDHIQKGIVNPNDISLVLELKYDGISVEAEVTDQVLSARTRGDTNMDRASDITPILKGYKFPRARIGDEKITPFGMKFEAVIDKYSLQLLSEEIGKKYANPRNAIIGIIGNGDAHKYAKYITLVPLSTSRNYSNRLEELRDINEKYSTGEICRHVFIRGNYQQILTGVRDFVNMAESMRDRIPIMYDGIVVSYLDPSIREVLGRRNSINRYSFAIKFNPKKKLTRVRDVTYSVGSDGCIVPLFWYDPVEFFGNIQTKSSGHSYGRFRSLNLKPGDIIECEYTNDVMTYITKADVQENYYNPNIRFQFITNCPKCGNPITISESLDKAMCKNMDCPGRRVARVTNMLKNLGFKGFSDKAVEKLDIKSFYDLMNMSDERANILGDTNGENLMCAIYDFQRTPIVDYNVVGAIGFTNVAANTWKSILSHISFKDIITSNSAILYGMLVNIKGIGDSIASIIVEERDYFNRDLLYIYNNMPNIIFSKGNNDEQLSSRKTIRFTGVRDMELMMSLCNLGHDCSEGSVTKKTDILIVPYIGFESTKTKVVDKYNNTGSNIKVVSLNDFKLNQDTYLGEI